MTAKINRRDALKSLGALAGAGAASRLLTGCDGAAGAGAITHLVVLMQENRSYDHMLGARSMLEGKPGDGLVAGMSNPDRDGNPVAIWNATADTMCVPDPPHGWDAAHGQFANGDNTGFLVEHQRRHPGDLGAMQYLVREQAPTTWALADAYTSCDRWFASVMGPTWPNRMYWHSGQSNGILSNEIPTAGFDWATIYDRLDAKGVDWAYYYGSLPVLAAVDRLAEGDHLRAFADHFFEDVEAAALPPVTYIDPAFFINDDHPPQHPIFGQQLIASIYTALARSKLWKNCLFVVTYDEHGGFFDHVAPPTTDDDFASAGFDQLGFRVPTLVVGPYVKQGVVSTVYDHTSVLKHIETMFDLEPLTRRSTAAADLADCLDQDRLATGDWREPVAIPAVEVDRAMLGASCSNAEDLHHDIIDWWKTTGGKYAHLDRSRDVERYLTTINEYLRRSS